MTSVPRPVISDARFWLIASLADASGKTGHALFCRVILIMRESRFAEFTSADAARLVGTFSFSYYVCSRGIGLPRWPARPAFANTEFGDLMAEFKSGGMAACGVPGQGLDGARFREAMSHVAAAVHIVTTGGPAGLGGITATSVVSITAEPPMMLFCINKISPSAARMIENGVFCINTLSPLHEPLADIFAGRTGHHLDERFASGEWTKLVTGAPVLKRAAVVFDCRLAEVKEVMTHFIMIGSVEAVEYGRRGSGLTYAHREYGNV